MKLSVVMPVYNERATLRRVVNGVLSLSLPFEIELLCVDDGSTDTSREILAELQREHPAIRVLLQPHNLGKGAAGQAVQNMNLALGYPETEGLL